jgi:hypothetical protein
MLADIIITLFAVAVSVCAWLGYLRKGLTVAESGAYALMSMLMLQSWMAQVLFMAGAQRLQVFVQALLIIPAVVVIVGRRRRLFWLVRVGLRYQRFYRVPAWVLGGAVIALTVLNCLAFSSPGATLVPQQPAGWWHLSGSVFSGPADGTQPALYTLNHAILMAPWQPAAMARTANLCAWMIIALSTYALARRYAWPGTAATAALLVAGMPRLLQQVLVPYSDLLPAAAAIVAVLALFRAVEQPHGHDLAMLAAAVCFTVAGGKLCYLLPLVLLVLSLLVLGRRHGIRLWPAAVARHPRALIAALAAILVFAQPAVVIFNLAGGRSWMGSFAGDQVVFNADGLAGAGANLIRYLLQSIHMPDGVDKAVRHVFGFSPVNTLYLLYQKTLGAAAGAKGAAEPFTVSWARHDPLVWFGPTGFLLILPSVLYAARKGPRRLKNTASALVAYWVLIALILAWRPQNVSLMTPFFVCGGFCAAFFLPPWRFSRRGRLVLQLLALLIGIDTLLA